MSGEEFNNAGLVSLALNVQIPQEWAMPMIKNRGTYLDSNQMIQYYIANEIQRAHTAVLDFWDKNGDTFLKIIEQLPILKVSIYARD